MKTSLKILLGLLLAGAAAVAAAALVIVPRVNNLDIAAEIPDPPIITALTHPANGSNAVPGLPLEIRAETIAAEGLEQLELWVDGEKAASTTDAGANFTWNWQTTDQGTHTLQLRAFDRAGNVQLSNVVQIEVPAPDDTGVILEMYTTGPGETAAAIAAARGLPTEDILAYNSVSADSPLPPGALLLIPEAPLPDPPEPGTPARVPAPDEAVFTGSSAALWFALNLPFSPAPPQAAPSLSAAADACSVHLELDFQGDDALGYSIYRLAPGQSAFRAIAYLDASQTSFTDTEVGGDVQYYASAFNAGGEMPGNIAPVSIIDPECGVPIATDGGLVIEDGLLQTNVSAAAVYLYVSYDGDNWDRVPAEEGSFIGGIGSSFDLNPYLPNTGGFSFEAWGWSGGELVFLGSGTGPGAAQTSAGFFLLPIDVTSLVTIDFSQSPDTGVPVTEKTLYFESSLDRFNLEFQWQTDSPAQTGLWQVSAWPFASSPDLNPPGLLAEGMVSASQLVFFINFADIVSPAPGGGSNPAPTAAPSGPLDFSNPFSTAPLDLDPGSAISTQDKIGVQIPDYYVRILPMANNQVVGFPSNTVTIHYGSPPEPEPIVLAGPMSPLYQVKFVKFNPGSFPDPNRWGCVVVVEIPEVQMIIDPYNAEVGEVVCPSKLPGEKSGLVEFINVLGGAWDWAANKVNALKAKVVDLIGEQVCTQADLASGGLGLIPKEECKTAVAVGIDVVLASYGIPPSVPTYDMLVEEGKEYLVELAAQELRSRGIPCEETCKDLIRKGLDEAIETMASESTEPGCVPAEIAKKYGKEPLCMADWGYIVRPAQDAAYYEPTVILEVTRIPGVEPPSWFTSNCRADVSMRVSNTYSDVSGVINLNEVLYTGSAELLDMAPGQVMNVPLALTPTNAWLDYDWYKSSNEDYGVKPPTPYGLSLEWFAVYNGGTAFLEVSDQFSSQSGACLEALNTWTEALP